MKRRLNIFQVYWKEHDFLWNLICVAFITLGILVLTYLFLAISRLMSNFFENIIIPQIQKWSKGKIVTQEVYQSVLTQVDVLEAKIEAERKAKNEAIRERDEFEKSLYGGKNEKVIDTEQVEMRPIYTDIIEKVNTDFGAEEVEKTLLKISKSGYFSTQNKLIDFLLKNQLVTFKKENSVGAISYDFTIQGDEFRRQYFENNN